MSCKKCSKCKQLQSISHFYKKRQNKDGLSGWCRSCTKKYYIKHPPSKAAKRRALKKYKQSPKGKLSKRRYSYKKKYGLALEDYDKMLEQQNGVCYICGEYETHRHQNGAILRLTVDHSHKTGKVRKLLCKNCNLMIANADESIRILAKAIQYLQEME